MYRRLRDNKAWPGTDVVDRSGCISINDMLTTLNVVNVGDECDDDDFQSILLEDPVLSTAVYNPDDTSSMSSTPALDKHNTTNYTGNVGNLMPKFEQPSEAQYGPMLEQLNDYPVIQAGFNLNADQKSCWTWGLSADVFQTDTSNGGNMDINDFISFDNVCF